MTCIKNYGIQPMGSIPREYSIVLLSGWSGSGKDVAANLMCEEMGYTRLAFADIVRQEVSEKTKIHTDYFSSPLYKDLPIPTRLADFPNAITYRDVVIEWATTDIRCR